MKMSGSMSTEVFSAPNKSNPMRAIYLLGGLAAFASIFVALSEIIITFLPGGNVRTETVTDWFSLLGSHPFMGLRNLGLINVFILSLGLPLYYALFIAHGKGCREMAGLALIVNLLSTAIFFGTNRAFPLLELSRLFARAGTEAEKSLIESAGLAMLAVGKSHSPGTFFAFAFGEVSGLLMSLAMLRGGVFGRRTAFVGLLGFAFLLGFEILTFLSAGITGISMALAMLGGLFNLAWLFLVGRRFLALRAGREGRGTAARPEEGGLE